ncbi:MAG: DNA polymerase IV [Hyphococcus sp.]|nr:MAG: DNA polymerase IV [Marinicaulis sp.]
MSENASQFENYHPVRGLSYLFLDFNAYFASVEQHDHPELMGRPVIVTPLQSEHTGAIAASYEAKAFGIKRGTKVKDARELCPDIAVMPARHDRYVQLHNLLMAEIQRHLPLVKIYSIDEAAFQLSRSERDPARAIETAKKVKCGIAENVGPAMRASIGLAPSRLLAKLAAERVKPDGLTVLQLSDLPGKLAEMPLRDIPGVGAGVERRLARADITNFPALWALEPKQARAIWGSVTGERFWYGLHGYETVEEPTKKSMIGHSRVLSREYEAPDRARLVARALLLKAASRLRHYGMHASSMSLSVRLRPEGRWETARRFSYSQDSYLFLKTLNDMWTELIQFQRKNNAEGRLGGVTVYLHGLAKEADSKMQQGDLFADAAVAQTDDKRAKLWRIIDQINADPKDKFNRLSGAKEASVKTRHISLASQSSVDLNYLGAKIAFSRVPDEAEFLY